jgi:hydrogenase assembly chaperone HypC/HupF
MTIPGQVRTVAAGTAQVELDGRLREVSTILHPEVAVGDWVIVTAGTILERLDPTEAAYIRAEIARAAAAESAETAGT